MAKDGMKRLENTYISKIKRRIAEIRKSIWTECTPVEDAVFAETMDHLSIEAARELDYQPVETGHRWGKPWSTAWFRFRFRIPAEFKGEAVSFLWQSNGEGLVYRDGVPMQGLERNRHDYPLTKKARGGEKLELFVEVGANKVMGNFAELVVDPASVGIFVPQVWDIFWDLKALADMIDELPNDDTRRAQIVFQLSKAVDAFDYRDKSLTALKNSARRVKTLTKPLYAGRAAASAQTIACMGHAHIDVAWLWPLAETRRKNGRTFSNVLAYMDEYPEYIFCQSQPQLYEYTKENYPSLYKRIQAKVREGQWIPTGCWWVEADCNVTSGESLVRQTLFGVRFFQEEFDVTPSCLWIPDVFGYAACIPQILKRSGIDYFLTQKISWNQYTTHPYHSFYWEGIDGSRVLTHFPPANNYNAQLLAEELLRAEKNYLEKDRSPIQAIPYGHGDGGGGPTKDMLERRRRYEDLDGMPKLQPMSTRQFFETLEHGSEDLPTWVGELYGEFHRGTLTTQAYNKRNNRRSELTLRNAEFFGVVNLVHGNEYPQAALHDAWKKVLLNQFHDIIPGSSITKVYEDSDRDYAYILDTAETCRDQALTDLAAAVDTTGDGRAVVLFNSLSWSRDEVVAANVPRLRRSSTYVAVAPDGSETPVQFGADGQIRFKAQIPAMGHAVYHIRTGEITAPAVHAAAEGMENECLKVRFDKQGCLRGVHDKINRRQVLAGGPGNQFQLFEDKPNRFEAWDIDLFYQDKPLEMTGDLQSIDVIEQGPVRAVVRVVRRISQSTITQDIILAAGADRLDFKTTIDWGAERRVLLKVAFPVMIHSDRARYEIQFGNIERPTHWNTPQDFAKFEVCGQKWADLDEGDYGVALLNDCKYGHDIRGNTMRLTLLRAPLAPDPKADINKQHQFTYSLLPHTGDFRNGVVRQGYELNVPVQAQAVKAAAGPEPACTSRFEVSSENVIIEAVKRAEDDDGVIVRLYEAYGQRCRCSLKTTLPFTEAGEVNLLEEPERPVSLRQGTLNFSIKPYEIRTFKFTV